MTLSRTDFKIAFVLTLLGMASSTFPLFAPIHGDEAASFLADWSYPFSNLLFQYSDITNHKLFTALSCISMALFGDNELNFRLPLFFAGASSIPLIYFLTQLTFSNRQTSLISSFLLLFSYPRFFYSINGRGYIFSILLAIVLSLVLIKLLEPKPKIYWKAL
jgi:4-amino-4-deoxy-L-arabinose transferase-like glycosyltransferase